jgi:hypothetical protein
VIVCRIAVKRWTRGETLLLVLFSVFYLGTIAQVLFADRILVVSRRYLLPFTPLLFGFTAIGVLKFYDWLKRPVLFVVLAVLLALVLLWDASGPIIKEYYTRKRIAENAAIKEIARFIQGDFKQEKTRGELPVWWYEPRSPARPILKNAPPQLSYLVGGTYWNEFFPDDPVDYLIVPAGEGTESVPDGFVPVFETEVYRVFKPADPGESDEDASGGEAETAN